MPKVNLIKPMTMAKPSVVVTPKPEIRVEYMEGTNNEYAQTDITGPIVAAIGQFENANVLNITGEQKKNNQSAYPIASFSYLSKQADDSESRN